MHRLSMAQALSLWTDLMDAYHGKNGYGGDVCELYMHRLMPSHPMADPDGGTLAQEQWRDVVRQANGSLYALLAHFTSEMHVAVDIMVLRTDHPITTLTFQGDETKWAWRRLGSWVREMNQDHRVHVRITRVPD